MSGVRRSDGLLPATQIAKLARLVAERLAPSTPEQIVRDFAALNAASWARTWNSVSILRELNVVEDQGDYLAACRGIPMGHGALEAFLASAVATNFAAQLATRSSGAVQAGTATQGLWLDSRLLPGSNEGWPFLVIEFGIATRERTDSRFWRVQEPFDALVLSAVAQSNEQHVRRALSATALEQQLEENAENGRLAELWVEEFERDRLAGHPLLRQVRRISDEDVGAGFDIISFSSVATLNHDRFIEVKSYERQPRFFWTANEMSRAQILGEQYCLYLVDRTKMGEAEYTPRIIHGPYSALVVDQESGWQMQPAVFRFTLASADQ